MDAAATTVRWYVTIDPDVDVNVSAAQLGRFIDQCLSDPEGWRSRGWAFRRVTEAAGRAAREDGSADAPVWIRFSQPRTIAQRCGFGDRSCADMRDRVIFLNAWRWLNGSTEVPEMTLTEYRKAVVVHEMGHILGSDHVPCPAPGSEGDVMQEFTKLGWSGCLATKRPTVSRPRPRPRIR
jgi:hypothetical protein